MRHFFALWPPRALRASIAALRDGLWPRDPAGARAVPASNFHVTLAFLGDLPPQSISGLQSVAAELRLPTCRLVLDRLGRFAAGQVDWLGGPTVPEPLVRFQGHLVRALQASGYVVDERPWVPHLTLYRNLRKPPERMNFKPLEWDLEEFHLVSSETRPDGPVYRSVDRWAARLPGDF